MDDLPVEIKEMIIYYCDGESLFNLQQINQHWKILVDKEDERRNLFKSRLKSDIEKNTLKDVITKLYPKKNYLYSNPDLYKFVFYATLRWKYFNNSCFKIKKLPHKFSVIIDLKTSGNTILVGDKCGLYVIKSLNDPLIFFGIGRVKNIELFCTSSKATSIDHEYDEVDVMTENNVHHFFNLQKNTFYKKTRFRENKCIKYWMGKSIELDMKKSNRDPVLKADFYENFVMMVTEKNVIQSKSSSLSKVRKTPFNSHGWRVWFLWHSKLVICAKDDSLEIFCDGATTTIDYHLFPPVSAIFYHAGWLFLGSRYEISSWLRLF
ncbi:uncharacterized protein LOC135843344 isoform X2 [Planococcus citri]|uniref:uncharacterized protein LOC135843344 isoform X2 n=1 Tax=Planococcus citri TaxID=170843 RepID=UPI0031F9CE56